MKTKIIAVVVSIVIIAGVGTAVGVTVSKSNDKETESLVNEAVSNALASALATEESTAEESTTEESTAEDSSKPSSQSSSSPKNNAPSQTKASTATATEQQTVGTGHKIDSQKDSYIKNDYKDDSPEEDNLMEYKNAIINGETVLTYYVHSGPNGGKVCYYNSNNELVYIDDISKIEFVKPQIPEIPEWD